MTGIRDQKGALLVVALLMFALPLMAAEPVVAPLKDETAKAAVEKEAGKEAVKEEIIAPDTSKIMFIQNLRRIGATVYYLGEAMHLHGWLVVKGEQIQILYTTPDSRAVIVGALLSAEGANISQQQILMLANSKPEIARILGAGKSAGVQINSNDTGIEDMSAKGKAKAEQMMEELAKVTAITFGKEAAPRMFMIMDVHNSDSKTLWTRLERFVDEGRLRVAMVPTNMLGPQSEVDAANWINAKDPLDAWRKHVAGDDKILKIGEADVDKEKSVFYNTQFAKKWQIAQVPFLIYRGKNGKVRILQGLPEKIDALVDDVKGEATP